MLNRNIRDHQRTVPERRQHPQCHARIPAANAFWLGLVMTLKVQYYPDCQRRPKGDGILKMLRRHKQGPVFGPGPRLQRGKDDP